MSLDTTKPSGQKQGELEVAKMMSVRIKRNLDEGEHSRAVANYASLEPDQQKYVREQDYWSELDKLIDKGVNGQI